MNIIRKTVNFARDNLNILTEIILKQEYQYQFDKVITIILKMRIFFFILLLDFIVNIAYTKLLQRISYLTEKNAD